MLNPTMSSRRDSLLEHLERLVLLDDRTAPSFPVILRAMPDDDDLDEDLDDEIEDDIDDDDVIEDDDDIEEDAG